MKEFIPTTSSYSTSENTAKKLSLLKNAELYALCLYLPFTEAVLTKNYNRSCFIHSLFPQMIELHILYMGKLSFTIIDVFYSVGQDQLCTAGRHAAKPQEPPVNLWSGDSSLPHLPASRA